MKTDDLLDRSDSFEVRLRAGLDHIAEADPVADPGLFDPDVMPLATPERHGRDRRLAPVLVAASVAALTIGGLAVIATRDSAPAATDQPSPPAAEPTLSQPAVTGPVVTSSPVESLSGEVCDDAGCDSFDPLPTTTAYALSSSDENQMEHRIDFLLGQGPLDALGYTIASTDIQPDSPAIITINSISDGRTMMIKMSAGTPLQPENHNRVPITILDETELEIRGQLNANSGWTFEIVAERSAEDGPLPTQGQLQGILFALDP